MVAQLMKLDGFSAELVEHLARLPGFRNVVMHDYVDLDYGLVLAALDALDPVREFSRVVSDRLE